MDCPACHAENAFDATTCNTCGRPLPRSGSGSGVRPARRSGSRRRGNDAAEAALDTAHPEAQRAYRTSLWSIVPGIGLFLGPVAMVMGLLALRKIGEDRSARNRARTAMLFGLGSALTQWLGVTLIYRGW